MPYKYRESRRRAVNKYYLKNKEKICRRARERGLELRSLILQHYGKKCVCCGETSVEFLTIDHINNDGRIIKKKLKTHGGHGLYRWIVKNKFPKDLQILCFNCNCAKGIYGYCPHWSNNGQGKVSV